MDKRQAASVEYHHTRQNRLLWNLEPFNPYRQGNSTALVMPIRSPATMSGLFVHA